MGVRGVVMQGIPSSGINSPTINHAAAKPIAISASSSPAMANQPLVVSGAGPAANSRTATVSPAMGVFLTWLLVPPLLFLLPL